MDSLTEPLEDLTTSIETLTTTLQPLLTTPLTTTTSKLPLLDKAKLYVLATYALESVLFSSLRLSGVDAKEHPVFAELARVRGYFGKIREAEEGGRKDGGGRGRVDKEAVGRFVRAGLAGNPELRKRRVGELEGEVGTHTRFEGSAKRIRAAEGSGDAEGGAIEEGRRAKYTKFDDGEGEEEEVRARSKHGKAKSDKAPKNSGEALQSLLGEEGSEERKGKKKKKKNKGQAVEGGRAEEME